MTIHREYFSVKVKLESVNMDTSVYLNCWRTGAEAVPHSMQSKTPSKSSGRTSDVFVTVPLKLVRHPMDAERSSRSLKHSREHCWCLWIRIGNLSHTCIFGVRSFAKESARIVLIGMREE